MSKKTAILAVRVVGDAKGGQKAITDTESKLQKFERGLGKATKVATVTGAATVAFAKSLESTAEAAGTARAGLDTVIRNVGEFGAQHDKVVDRLIDNAERLARTSGINPNEIKNGQQVLAAYESVAASADEVGGAFDRATQAAVDLSAAGYGSVEKASERLGRALEDPTQASQRLRRSGIELTDAQQEQINAFHEAGDAAAAQNAILEAVEKRFSGVAENTADDSDKMKVAWQLTREELAQKLVPVFEKVRAAGIKLAEFVADHSTAVMIAVGVIGGLSAAVLAVNAAYKAYRAVMVVATAAQWAMNVAMNANPLGLLILAITAVVAGFVLLYKRSERFRNIVQAAGRIASDAIGWVVDRVSSLISWMRAAADNMSWVGDVGRAAFDAVTWPIRTIIDLVSSLISWIGSIRWPSPPGWVKSIGGGLGSLFGAYTPPGGAASYGAGSSYRPEHYTAPGDLHAASPSMVAAPTGGRRAGGGQYVHIEVKGAVDPVGTARTIAELLARQGYRTGTPVAVAT